MVKAAKTQKKTRPSVIVWMVGVRYHDGVWWARKLSIRVNMVQVMQEGEEGEG